MPKKSFIAAVLALALVAPGHQALADAQHARIGVRTEAASIDPHFSYVATSKAMVTNIFDTLIERDPDLRLTPALATEWTYLGDSVWQFKLREGVKWHDGEPLTVDDVLFTFERAPNVPNSPAPFGQFLSQIERAEKVDDLTFTIKTRNPSPQLLFDLAEVPIVSEHVGKDAKTEDYNSGKAAVGTGPFKFVSWTPGEALELARNDDYWAGPSEFETLSQIPITNDAARLAALLSGGIDLMDAVPPDAVERLKADEDINVWMTTDVYTAYLHMDTDREVTPFITAKDGSQIPNPLLDKRVREALAIAVDREAIIDRLMFGLGEPAGQLASKTMVGYNPELEPSPYDVARAKELLAEAGYPDGFKMTLHGPNNRYVADAAIVQALAQMFERIGIAVAVETMPANVFFSRGSAQEFSIFFIAWGSAQGTAWHGLRGVLMTYDKDQGYGPSNRGRYSNPEVDRLTVAAMSTFDLDEAARLASEAAKVAFEDFAVIPLHYQMNVWASRDGFVYKARQDQMTLGYGLGLEK
ncbi:ABC transporter substrate-binding protein [Arenibaculum sp.]|uniref:ABC transporter substrate-binding protein n=1 Tax=Arenibaculum sp. TaxID=2865862 RepID=UPI002E0FCB43|nr:ABC transporter substrate-binding protein [Arenibaculum sp.]